MLEHVWGDPIGRPRRGGRPHCVGTKARHGVLAHVASVHVVESLRVTKNGDRHGLVRCRGDSVLSRDTRTKDVGEAHLRGGGVEARHVRVEVWDRRSRSAAEVDLRGGAKRRHTGIDAGRSNNRGGGPDHAATEPDIVCHGRRVAVAEGRKVARQARDGLFGRGSIARLR